MISNVIIASYGGSGSTFLAKKIHQILPEVRVFHTHGVPSGDFIGIPTRNLYTGHDEGPLSDWLPCDQNTKIIMIARKPSHAYKSRACFKHFAHIWWGTPLFDEIIGENKGFEESGEKFNQVWADYIQNEKDILHLQLYLEKWVKILGKNEQDIFFVKYNHLEDSWESLLEFLGAPNTKENSINDEFSVKSRDVDIKTNNLMAETDIFFESLPNYKVATRSISDSHKKSVIDTPATFTVSGLNAGFGDSFSRMDLVHRFVKEISNAKFYLPLYKNYHSKDLDFFSLFSLKTELETSEHSTEIKVKFSEFINRCYSNSEYIKQSVNFNIIADLYERDSFLSFYPEISSDFTLKKDISLNLEKNVFSSNSDCKKVTIHLRRSDISKRYFEGVVPDSQLDGIHDRELLTVKEAVNFAKNYFEVGSKIEFIIASDGIEELKTRFKETPSAKPILENIEKEIFEKPDISAQYQYVIGKSKADTIKTLEAFAQSDLVITKSSCFPNLMCELSKVKLVHL